jgi:hypothetical protein
MKLRNKALMILWLIASPTSQAQNFGGDGLGKPACD